MKRILSTEVRLWATFLISLFASSVQSAQLIDDRAITIHSARELAAKRRALIQYLWGAGGFDATFQTNTIGSPMKYFLEPTAISLNHLKTQSRTGHFPKYRAFHMIGLSGGGWTTTVYAAIDPAIRCSFPVAGTIPLFLRTGGSVGDREQFESSFYQLAGYPDLYILGAHGRGRKQVQILVRRDDCCFGEAQHDAKAMGVPYANAMREYETRVQTTLKKIGKGSFHLEIDEKAPSHMISRWAIE